MDKSSGAFSNETVISLWSLPYVVKLKLSLIIWRTLFQCSSNFMIQRLGGNWNWMKRLEIVSFRRIREEPRFRSRLIGQNSALWWNFNDIISVLNCLSPGTVVEWLSHLFGWCNGGQMIVLLNFMDYVKGDNLPSIFAVAISPLIKEKLSLSFTEKYDSWHSTP